MSTPHELAVIICSRDRPLWLRGALTAIRETTPPGVEIIVVDSASVSEQTYAVALTAGVGYVRADVSGLSIARNIGLAATTRRLVLFTDDDCRPEKGWIDAVLRGFDNPATAAVSGRMLDQTGAEPRTKWGRRSHLSRPIEGLDGGHGALMAFDREYILELGGFDDVLGAGREFGGAEDLDMFVRVLLDGRVVERTALSSVRHVNVREGAEHSELHHRYGLGLGAMCNKFVRMRFWVGVRLLAVVTMRTIRRIISPSSDSQSRAASRAMLRGIGSGFARARRLPVHHGRFVDIEMTATATTIPTAPIIRRNPVEERQP